MDLDFYARFKQSIEEIKVSGEKYAEARAKSYYAQEMKGAILATLIHALPEMPVSKAEITAKASVGYTQHLKETAEAVKLEYQWKNALEVAKAKFEGNRSLSSLEKITRSLIDGD